MTTVTTDIVFRVWADLLNNGWTLASFAYSNEYHANRHRDFLAAKQDRSVWRAFEVRPEPRLTQIVIDDIDELMKSAGVEDWPEA